MKKLILSAAFLTFAGLTAVKADSKANITNIVITAQQDSVTKTPVKLEDLPEAVKTTLNTDPVKAWTPTAAFLVKDQDKEYYQVDVKKDQEVASLKIDKDGKIIQ